MKFLITVVCNITVHNRGESPPYSSLVIFRLKHVIRQRCVSRHYFYPPCLVILSSLSVIINRIANKPVLITTATPWDNATRTLGATNDTKYNFKPTEYRRTRFLRILHTCCWFYRVFVVPDYRVYLYALQTIHSRSNVSGGFTYRVYGLQSQTSSYTACTFECRLNMFKKKKKNLKDFKQNILYVFKRCNERNIKLEKNTVQDVWKTMSRQRSNFDLIYLSNFLNSHTHTRIRFSLRCLV